ncbi:MAG: hypothetical protein IKO47_11200 [Ruminococcus sp.]|nr:hypothetical protein [Ruminococcus sp.]
MNMKRVGRKMSVMMGITMSFCMSLIGNLMSGHFSVPGFLISFLISVAISLVIGFFVPVGSIAKGASSRCGLERGSTGARVLESLVMDFIFTPVMTLSMVSYAYMMSKKHDVEMNFLPALLTSLGIGLVVGFILAFLLTPVYLKIAMKGEVPSGPPPHAGDREDE